MIYQLWIKRLRIFQRSVRIEFKSKIQVQVEAEVIPLLENGITFDSFSFQKGQFDFNICEVNQCRIQIDKS